MDITDNLVNEMADVQENAIEQLDKEKEQVKSGLLDAMGRNFDKAMHIIDEQGEPKLTKDGKLRIKRGYGPGAKQPKISTIGGVDGLIGFAQTQEQSEAEILVTGQSAASLTFVVGMAFFGSDGKPTQEEINQVTYGYQSYFRAKNIRDLPPGVVLATALMTYALPRMIKPKTSKKISSLWDKAKRKFSKNRTPETVEDQPLDTEV